MLVRQNKPSWPQIQGHPTAPGPKSLNKSELVGGANWGHITSLPGAVIGELTPEMAVDQTYICLMTVAHLGCSLCTAPGVSVKGLE